MVGRDGIEPSTNGLKVHCSTAELTARKRDASAGCAAVTRVRRGDRMRMARSMGDARGAGNLAPDIRGADCSGFGA